MRQEALKFARVMKQSSCHNSHPTLTLWDLKLSESGNANFPLVHSAPMLIIVLTRPSLLDGEVVSLAYFQLLSSHVRGGLHFVPFVRTTLLI